AYQRVQAGDAGGASAERPRPFHFCHGDTHAWVHLQTRLADAEVVQARHRRLPARFDDLELTYYGVAVGALGQRDDAVGDGEDRALEIVSEIFADQKRRGLPDGQVDSQTLREVLEVDRAGFGGSC